MSLFAFNILSASQNPEIAERLPAGCTAFFESDSSAAPGQIVAIQDGERVALNVYSDTSAAPVHMVCGRSDGLLWLRIFYLDALDAQHGPNLSTPAPCADFLLSPKQYLSAAPLLCGMAS